MYHETEGRVSLRFDPALKPYLLQLKGYFTKIEMGDLLHLKSVYAIRIFEILLQYLTLGGEKQAFEELKQYLGIKKNEYKLYANLSLVLSNAPKTEINTKTEYDVDYDEIKTSRKVTAIEWEIKKKPESFQTSLS